MECVKTSDELLEIKTPNLQVREILEKLGYTAPAHMKIEDIRKEILEGIPIERVQAPSRKRRKKETSNPPISPEEKQEAKENEKRDREQRKAAEKARKQEERAKAKAQRKKEREVDKTRKKNDETAKEENVDKNKTERKKPGVPKGYKRGQFNKDGSLRKKPGPKTNKGHSVA